MPIFPSINLNTRHFRLKRLRVRPPLFNVKGQDLSPLTQVQKGPSIVRHQLTCLSRSPRHVPSLLYASQFTGLTRPLLSVTATCLKCAEPLPLQPCPIYPSPNVLIMTQRHRGPFTPRRPDLARLPCHRTSTIKVPVTTIVRKDTCLCRRQLHITFRPRSTLSTLTVLVINMFSRPSSTAKRFLNIVKVSPHDRNGLPSPSATNTRQQQGETS